jgi:hypothetical protein
VKRLLHYLKEPVISIGWYTGIDVKLPRGLNILFNVVIGIIMFIGIGEIFRDLFGLPLPFKI